MGIFSLSKENKEAEDEISRLEDVKQNKTIQESGYKEHYEEMIK